MMEVIRSRETSVLTRATRRHIPEDGILQFLYCFVNICCYADLAFLVRLLRRSLLCRHRVKDVPSDQTIQSLSGHATAL
jgi:hypothetical protein